MGFSRDAIFITSSVNSSHPTLWCASDTPGSVVNVLFRSKTPCELHGERSPEMFFTPRSSCNSLNIFLRVGGRRLHSDGTPNASPIACLGFGYGSWPRITTLVSANGVDRHLKMSSKSGMYELDSNECEIFSKFDCWLLSCDAQSSGRRSNSAGKITTRILGYMHLDFIRFAQVL